MSLLNDLGIVKKTMDAYCVKCRTRVKITDIEDFEMENKKQAWKGKCVECKSVVYKIKPVSREGMW